MRRAGGRRAAMLGIAGGLLLGLAPAAGAAGLDESCLLPILRVDGATMNVAFPDEAALYWVGAYPGVPGARLRIDGRFPHARYSSFNLYDAQLRPTAALTDRDIVPDAGSTNPFLPGADRDARARSYTAWVQPGAAPARPAANTLYAGTNPGGLFIYRIYVPDRDRGETGGVGLPRVTVELPGGASEPLSLVDCTHVAKPTSAAVTDAIAQLSPPAQADAVPYPGSSPPRWRKFQNLPTSVVSLLLDNDAGRPLADRVRPPLEQAGGEGGFLSNRDNAYVATVVNRAFGQVLVVQGRAPTFPDTRDGAARMPAAQLRYWSMCQNEFATQRYIACRTDDQTVVDRHGRYTYVVSTAAQRPANARAACGVTWIPWGPSAEGVLIYRHMLPSAGYAQAIQRATPGREAATMGDTLPAARYLPARAAFEARGCDGATARVTLPAARRGGASARAGRGARGR